MKRFFAIFLTLAMITALFAGCTQTDSNDTTAKAETQNVSGNDTVSVSDAFSDGDDKDVSKETPNAEIALSGNTGTISDTTRGASGSEVTVTSKGIYKITGTSEGVKIVINDETESGNIYLLLDNVSMENTDACIEVLSADKVILQCVGENRLTSTGQSAVYAKDDITINGSGTLTLTSDEDGVTAKDDLKITGAALTVNAGKIGLNAGDSVRIGGGQTVINAGHDGIQLRNDDGTAYFYMEEGSLTIDAGYDGIDVGSDSDVFTGDITLVGGALNIVSGGGSGNSKNSSVSQKGVKCDGNIHIGNVSLSVSSADDAVSSNADVSVSNGAMTFSTSDDGIHADGVLNISGGEIAVEKSYEGLEAEEINISGGNVSVYASDDGMNAAGGSDSSSAEAGPWGAASSGTLNISGGFVYVNAQGDGLDSNGSIYVSGGTVIVEGPTDGGNGALDKGDGSSAVCSITGGTVLALGSAGMAVNFDTGSQCSALVSLSGNAGTGISVDDGSGFSFTATKRFETAVYSSPRLQEGSTYTLTAGGSSVALDFTSSMYYSTVASVGMGGRRF